MAWSLGGLFTRLIPLDSWTMVAWRGLFGAAGLAALAGVAIMVGFGGEAGSAVKHRNCPITIGFSWADRR